MKNLLFIGQSIVVIGVSFYFYKRLQAVIFNINELHKIVLNQQEQINKQNLVIESLKNAFTSNFPRNNEPTRVTITPSNNDEKEKEIASNISSQPIQPSQPSKILLSENKTKSRLFSGINSTLIFKNKDTDEKKSAQIEIVEEKNEENNEEDDNEEDEDLDAELQNELRELESERNLKRK